MKRLRNIYFTLLILPIFLLSVETGKAQPQEAVFNFTGAVQSFVVPENVISINIQAWGAQGAATENSNPGLGGFAEGDLAVIPGQTLNIFVGGQGCVQNNGFGCGGFNGGGNARDTDTGGRGGGGGASDVRVGGSSLNARVIVAAGGGGSCNTLQSPGGNGGGLTGSRGGDSEGGFGGTQNSGGGGFFGCLNGQFGIGGSSPNEGLFTCAGGGGGWFGGGSGCGGGGGSSYIDGVENGNTTSGVREGNGMVVLTWEVLIRPIPTLSEWGLIAMAVALGAIGLLAARRRKLAA